MHNDFFALAEEMWSAWLERGLQVPPFIRAHCDLEASPEPYLTWGAADRPLVVLTTNPGSTLPHQLRDNILAGSSVARADEPYAVAARRLADWYQANLRGAAKRRLDGMLELAEAAGYDGVVQVELCPFHSPTFNRKTRYVEEVSRGGLLGRYFEVLREYVKGQPCLGVSAVSSARELAIDTVSRSPWLSWKSTAIGISVADSEIVPLVFKGTRATCAAVVARGVPPRVLVLMMGGNHLPGPEGRRRLAGLLRK